MSKFNFVILLVTFMAVGGMADEVVNNALDNLMFRSFCDRESSKAILSLCYSIPATNQANTFGTDVYSAAASGLVQMPAQSSAVTSTFTIATKGKVKITCSNSAPKQTAANTEALEILPAVAGEPVTTMTNLITGAAGTEVSGTYSKGATILYYGTDVPLKCTWTPA